MAKKLFGWIYTGLLLLFLYTPIVVLMVMSFNTSQYNALPIEFSLKWYKALAGNEKIVQATINSLWIGAVTAVLSVILATSLALGTNLAGRKTRTAMQSLVMLPLTMPWLIMGLSLLLLLRSLGLDRNFVLLLIGHLIISLPYSALVIIARVRDMGKETQEASSSLGASDWTTFYRVTLPMMLPAMLSGGFLSFMISFDNFVISYFLIPTGTTTLPMEIYSSIKFGFTPEMNAVATIILLASLSLIAVTAAVMRSSIRALFKSDKGDA
ncbi:ABC transporter permease [Sediminispirochaeta bajacaliforniensis]|uniref:ABC transporter permease n=1 Tax=Sediminispirochaeta bajacaliforniensis TaxID=148 RepID=UPI000363D345|nr:ABC transporter permease [Sediminispirochaeta bajacaliforniensis]